MKAYLFSAQTGVYEGETFVEADTLDDGDGVTAVPPPVYGAGQIPVFDVMQRQWVLVPLSLLKKA